jgi:hypothetical protein
MVAAFESGRPNGATRSRGRLLLFQVFSYLFAEPPEVYYQTVKFIKEYTEAVGWNDYASSIAGLKERHGNPALTHP